MLLTFATLKKVNKLWLGSFSKKARTDISDSFKNVDEQEY